MCYFITIGIPGTKVGDLLNDVPRELSVRPSPNVSLLKQFPTDFVSFLITSGMCSCDLFFGESEHRDKTTTNIRKYGKMGWSKSKINRAILQSSSNAETKKRIGLRGDVLSFLSDVSGKINGMKVIIHYYKGDVANEEINAGPGQTVKSRQLRSENLIRETDKIFTILSE